MSTQQVYRDLLEVMRSRRGPYAGLDIPEFFNLVEALFTPEQAAINNLLSHKPATVGQLALNSGRDEDSLSSELEVMADLGLCDTVVREGVRYYRGAPFMPGIFEYQFMPGRETERDKRIAHLIHSYKEAYTAAAGETRVSFPTTRVITVDRKIDAGNKIQTHDQVATYIDKYDSISITTCYCRHAAKLRGDDVHGMPMQVCMLFGDMAEYTIERLGGRKVNKDEAREVLDQAEEAGLIHMSRNTSEDISFLCNCDRWHCATVTTMLKQPKPGLVFNSGFEPKFDADLCVACEVCIDRCPPEALTMGGSDVPEVDLDLCFGCAVCATGCEQGAIMMQAKPGYPEPPRDLRELAGSIKAASVKGDR
jgi:Pyruvate/2-oxoacid:ferredoxin oxidoreductase delta subunit